MSIDDYLDKIEAEYLSSKVRQRKAIKGLKNKADVIDIGSAATMHLFEEVLGTSSLVDKSKSLFNKIVQYPSVIQTEYNLEKEISTMFLKTVGAKIDLENVVIFRGVYDSYGQILLSSQKRTLIVPEHMHQIHKACFVAFGFTLVEVPILENGLLDIEKLEKIAEKYRKTTSFVYINHNHGGAPTPAYLKTIGKILKKYNLYAVYDADVLFTAYAPKSKPWLPLITPEFSKRAIVLGNMTKEFGVPGLRIGYGVASKELANHIKKFQRTTLSIISPLTKQIATEIIRDFDLNVALKILQERMKYACEGFRNLGWNVESPETGVNLFLSVPAAFKKSAAYFGDELFCYHVASQAKILFRPSHTYGNKNGNEFRMVVCQPIEIMEKMFKRMKEHSISYGMQMPRKLPREYNSKLK